MIVQNCADSLKRLSNEHQQHRAAWLAKQAQPAGEWTRHDRCDGGWYGCWHLKGSALHVFGFSDALPSETHDVRAESRDEPIIALFSGTLAECKTWVEQHERERRVLDKLVGVGQAEKLPAGWRASGPYMFTHDSGAEVGKSTVESALQWLWWTAQPCDPCSDPKPTREEAMAAVLGYHIIESVEQRFAFGHDMDRLTREHIPGDGEYPTAQAAAFAALEYHARAGAK